MRVRVPPLPLDGGQCPPYADGASGVVEAHDAVNVVARVRFPDAPCVFGVSGYGESWDRRTPAGTIGGALLAGMVVTLDYPRRHIRFER